MGIETNGMTYIDATTDLVHFLVSCVRGPVRVPTTFMHSRTMCHICVGKLILYFRDSCKKNVTFGRQQHPCPAVCQSEGVCIVETVPQSVETLHVEKPEAFQYTKVSTHQNISTELCILNDGLSTPKVA